VRYLISCVWLFSTNLKIAPLCQALPTANTENEREREKSGCATCQLLTVLFEIQKEFMMFFGISKKTHYINVSPKQFLRFQAAMKLALN